MRVWLPFLVSALLIGLLGLLVDWSVATKLFARERLLELVFGVGLYVVSLVLRGLRFHLLLTRFSNSKVGWAESTDIAIIGSFANHVLPFRIGEAVFVFLANLRHGVPAERGTLAVVTARLYDLVSVLLVFAGAMLAMGAGFGRAWYLAVFALMLLAWIMAVRLDLALRLGGYVLNGLLKAVRFDQRRFARRLLGLIERAQVGLEILRSPRIIAATLALSLGIWLALVGCYSQLLAAFGMATTFERVAVGSLGASLVSMLPINAAGSVGTLEVGWSAGFVALGMPRSDAIASGIAMHVIVIIVSGLLAVVCIGRQGRQTWEGFLRWRRGVNA